MVRGASLALLLASLFPSSLEAQRAGAGFRGFSNVPGKSTHILMRGFSNGQFSEHFRQRDRPGAFFSPYFLPYDEPYWSEQSEPQPLDAEPLARVLYASPERERPPAAAQVIEIPGAANQKQAKLHPPAMFVLANGERFETQRFVLTVNSLSVNIDSRERVIPLDELDLGATTAANRERGINLRIPADRNEISLSF